MRVLHLYAGNLYGGIERLLATYAEQRDRCPHMQPSFALCFDGKLAGQIRVSGAPLHLLPSVRMSRPWTAWRSRRALRAFLKQSQSFDAILLHASWPHMVYAPVVKRLGMPMLFVAHDAYQHLSWLDRSAAKTPPALVIANSLFTASTVPALFPHVPIEVCHYPVSSPPPIDRQATRQEVRESLHSLSDRIVIVCMARMEHWKGQHLLIEALSKLQGDRWEAWIGGGAQRPEEQTYLDSLRHRAAELGIANRIKFIGQRNDVPRVLAAADIHCQPNSGAEPFGIAFIEALFAELPVITTRLGAPAEFIDASCGELTPAGDVDALAAALQRFIDDGRLRQSVGQGGPARAAMLCDVKRQLQQLHDLIENRLHQLAAR